MKKQRAFIRTRAWTLTDAAVEERAKVGGDVIVEVEGETFRVRDPD